MIKQMFNDNLKFWVESHFSKLKKGKKESVITPFNFFAQNSFTITCEIV